MIAIITSALFAIAASLPPQNVSPTVPSAIASQTTGAFERLAQDAKRAREENRDDAAIETYGRALQLKPEWDEGLWYLGTLLYKKENYFEACTVLRRFLAQEPGNAYGLAMLGLSESESHDYVRALGHLKQGLAIGLGDNRDLTLKSRIVTATLLTRSEQFDESMALLFSVMTDGADTLSLEEPFGLAALRLPFLPSEIPPGRREMIRMAGAATIAIEGRKYADADKIFNELEARYPDQPGVHFLIGAYLLSEHPDEGIKELKREIEIEPANMPARIRLAQEYIKQQNLDLGISLAQETLKLAPYEPLAHMVLGEGLIAKGDSSGGIGELESASKSLPDEVEVRWDLFRAYTAVGRKEDAIREKSEIERLSK
jgi:predicted Zn-dependent protease